MKLSLERIGNWIMEFEITKVTYTYAHHTYVDCAWVKSAITFIIIISIIVVVVGMVADREWTQNASNKWLEKKTKNNYNNNLSNDYRYTAAHCCWYHDYILQRWKIILIERASLKYALWYTRLICGLIK